VDEFAVGGDQVRGDEIVDGEAVLAHQPADAAAEGEAGDPGGGYQAAGGGQPEADGGDDIGDPGAAGDERGPAVDGAVPH
jgi:hypothetical protein